jgi:Translation initiation factor SUI1
LVNNIELFGIDIQEFSRKCQHGVAASTSISEVPGKKSRELLVQGNQIDFVAKLLQGLFTFLQKLFNLIGALVIAEEYKIPLRYLRGLEAAASKKKNKNKK